MKRLGRFNECAEEIKVTKKRTIKRPCPVCGKEIRIESGDPDREFCSRCSD